MISPIRKAKTAKVIRWRLKELKRNEYAPLKIVSQPTPSP